jgi:hypothetical protein
MDDPKKVESTTDNDCLIRIDPEKSLLLRNGKELLTGNDTSHISDKSSHFDGEINEISNLVESRPTFDSADEEEAKSAKEPPTGQDGRKVKEAVRS